MRAELHVADDPERIVAVATWDGRNAHVEVLEPTFAAPLAKLFRPTPVVVDDGSLRRLGTRGEVLVEPGTLQWFRAAVAQRVTETGLIARFVSDVSEGGWDPAGQYLSFGESVERSTST